MGAIGTGSTFTGGGLTNVKITDISWSVGGRESVEVTHMGSLVAKEYVPSALYDGGTLTIQFQFDGAQPPITGAVGSLSVVVPTETGSTARWEADGFMTSFDFSDPVEGLMTATASFKITGAVGAGA